MQWSDFYTVLWACFFIAMCYTFWKKHKLANLFWRFFSLDGMICSFARNLSQFNLINAPRRSFFLTLLAVVFLAVVGLIVCGCTTARFFREEKMEEAIAAMRIRMKFLESQYQGRLQDVINIQARIEGAGYKRTKVVTRDIDTNTTYSTQLSALMRKISVDKASDGLISSKKLEPIKPPFSLRIMPHLMEHPDSLVPAFQLGSSRQFCEYIIGVPHVMRDKETYLFDTLKNLLQNMGNVYQNKTMIVIMIGEIKMSYVAATATRIKQKFPLAVNLGLIEIISPNANYYPDMDAIPLSLGDSLKRVKWRSKQNLDVVYLMTFAYMRCLYFMILEDDVVAVNNYMADIHTNTAATNVLNPDWIIIQYSTTGGVGKLFRSTELIHFITFLQLFYKDMPFDWLTETYISDRCCGISRASKACIDAKNKIRPTFKKKLFKHIGLYSSLKGKIQPVKVQPPSNIQTAEFYPHDNPPVTHIKCDIDHYNNYSIENAYIGKSMFWGFKPTKGDKIEFWFTIPRYVSKYFIRSGNLIHVNDKIYNSVFEILPVEIKSNNNNMKNKNNYFVQIDRFDEFGMVDGRINEDKYGPLSAMRIRFESTSRFWVVISEETLESIERRARRMISDETLVESRLQSLERHRRVACLSDSFRKVSSLPDLEMPIPTMNY